MQNMKLIPKLGLALLFALFLTGHVSAAGFDGKSNLICAAKDVVGCVYEDGCLQGTASSFDVPNFIFINFEEKQITATKEAGIKSVSSIKSMETTEEQIIIQGVENHRGWNVAIDRKNGHLSVTTSGADLSYMIFGACTGL